jgi:3-oxoacyl-[acyl-carrier-protein] synthase II
VLPPNAGLQCQDEACDLHLVTADNNHRPIQVALSNAMGFGGQNSCVIVGKA